jgi:hypothetical protein
LSHPASHSGHPANCRIQFIALDIPDGKSRREVNNDIDCVSGRGGAPDTAMAARPGRAVADRTVDALCNNPRLHSAADVERIAA